MVDPWGSLTNPLQCQSSVIHELDLFLSHVTEDPDRDSKLELVFHGAQSLECITRGEVQSFENDAGFAMIIHSCLVKW